mmetsp:Transcript_76356/g.163755  ORF Transcript_76356/g.163755 Transcript_76356/m.163755 type:complete len:255 (+) Transcript_76356:921-1685(+)
MSTESSSTKKKRMVPKGVPSPVMSSASKPSSVATRRPARRPEPRGSGPSKRNCPSPVSTRRYSLFLLPWSHLPANLLTCPLGDDGPAPPAEGTAPADREVSDAVAADASSEAAVATASRFSSRDCQWLRFASLSSRSRTARCRSRSFHSCNLFCSSSARCCCSSSFCLLSSSLRCKRLNLGSDSRASLSTSACRASCILAEPPSALPSWLGVLSLIICSAVSRFSSRSFRSTASSCLWVRKMSAWSFSSGALFR